MTDSFFSPNTDEPYTAQKRSLHRFAANGALDSTYGAKGIATFVQTNFELVGSSQSVDLLEVEVASDGTALVLVKWTYELRGKVRSEQLSILRVDPSGKNVATRLLTNELGKPTLDGAIALAGGFVYASVMDNSAVPHIYKLVNDAKLNDASNWSTWGSFISGTSMYFGRADISVDGRGRVFLTGEGIYGDPHPGYEITAVKGPVYTFTNVARGTILLDKGGTLFVRGTAGADNIEFGSKRQRVVVTFNSRVYRFERKDVRGLVVQADAGNDKVYNGYHKLAAFLEGDDGNDTLLGGGQSDTLVGGKGNDSLDGEGDADYLYGQDGNDIVIGSSGPDLLFGGKGDDTLYSGSKTTQANSTDRAIDAVDSGIGRDLIKRDYILNDRKLDDVVLGFSSDDRYI
jgi:hypothetical protein